MLTVSGPMSAMTETSFIWEGIVIVNFTPREPLRATVMLPAWRSAMLATIESPRPMPASPLLVCSGLKKRESCSSEM